MSAVSIRVLHKTVRSEPDFEQSQFLVFNGLQHRIRMFAKAASLLIMKRAAGKEVRVIDMHQLLP